MNKKPAIEPKPRGRLFYMVQDELSGQWMATAKKPRSVYEINYHNNPSQGDIFMHEYAAEHRKADAQFDADIGVGKGSPTRRLRVVLVEWTFNRAY